jgi:hypothetical protein
MARQFENLTIFSSDRFENATADRPAIRVNINFLRIADSIV